MHVTKEELAKSPPILVDLDIIDASLIYLDEEEEANEIDEQVFVGLITIPLWVQKKVEVVGDLFGDPIDIQRTHSQFQGAPQELQNL